MPLCTIIYSSSGVSLLYFVVSFMVLSFDDVVCFVCGTDACPQANARESKSISIRYPNMESKFGNFICNFVWTMSRIIFFYRF